MSSGTFKLVCSPAAGGEARIAYPRLHLVRGPISQARGLIGMKAVDRRDAYLFAHCPTVHTHFMSVPIDVITCDREMHVLCVETMDPWKPSSSRIRGARTVVEAAAGSASAVGIEPGCRLLIAREG